ncbi:MAG: 6-phosphogluconolactonase [Actinobacteria bacterium]|uniref:Unannotated protein n=1 Tax=freshwater metagenome TaxID=449393 RepID=A0A6J7CTW2_9ZZZZ|nr:6-phosphogluconolactonase [Actinomycetota bacterium]
MTEREVLLHPDAHALALSAAAILTTRIVERQAAAGIARIVLTGGGIGTAVLAAAALEPGRDAVDWSRVELWWGDERYLPDGDPERNDTSARAALLDHVDIDPARVHSIEGPDRAASAEDSAEHYADHLRTHARPEDHGDLPRFDVVLLGIGPDSHVASLFPEHPALHETDRLTAAVHGSPKPPLTRVTLTLPAINAASEVWILASGVEKATAVRLALDPAAGALQVPAAGVRGRDRTLFLVDDDAASKLPHGLGRPIA